MDRRYFFRYSAIGATYLLAGCQSKEEETKTVQTSVDKDAKSEAQEQIQSYEKFSQKLQIPQVIDFSDTQEAVLKAQESEVFIFPQNKTKVMTFSNELPNPTIKIQKGQSFDINFSNALEKPTIIHWHGLIVPQEMDGHPKDVIENGESKHYFYDVNQNAGTFWYHTHPHGRTGKEIYYGLAGMYIIEDEKERALNLPSNEFDIPLMIQDKRFDKNKELIYKQIAQDNKGVNGDVILVNATPFPYHSVSSRKYRLRIANASSVRTYNLVFEGIKTFTLIGTDAGLLQSPVEVKNLLVSVAERVDVIVDFKEKNIGDTVTLKTLGVENATNMLLNENYPSLKEPMDIMEFKITQKSKSTLELPQNLIPIEKLKEKDAVKTRTITMEIADGGIWTLDNKKYDIDRIDQKVKLNTTEIWEIKNSAHMAHPFHIHSVKFQVLDRDSGKVLPTDKGWKDTVLVMPLETVRIIVHFTMPGIFLYHCHILEHEDNAMMANFLVQE